MKLSDFDKTRRRFVYANGIIIAMLVIGTLGFRITENLSWFDALYLTAATITTVGYGDIVPKTLLGRAFTTGFLMVSVGVVLYALSLLAQIVIQAELVSLFGTRRRYREMEKLKNHYIVCGAGRVGRRVIQAIKKDNRDFVVIDIDPAKLALLGDVPYAIEGDATLEENLLRAGVERAAGLAACLSDDAKNVYVVLTARDLNTELPIVARAVEEQAEAKLVRAGANRVVSPTIIGSLGMARSMMRPAIADFMDSIVAENLDLVVEEIALSKDSQYAGKSLMDCRFSKDMHLLVVAIKRLHGEMLFNPTGSTEIMGGDLLIVIGRAEDVQSFVHR